MKIKKISLLLLSLSFLCLSSCKSLKNLAFSNQPIDTLSYSGSDLLSGTYSNAPDTSVNKIAIGPHYPSFSQTSLFNKMSFRKQNTANPEKQKLCISILSKNRLKLILLEENKPVEELTIRGKFASGYFYGRQKIFLLPFIPLLWGYRFERFRIGRSGEHLIINFRTNQWAFGLFFGYSENGTFSGLYRKDTK